MVSMTTGGGCTLLRFVFFSLSFAAHETSLFLGNKSTNNTDLCPFFNVDVGVSSGFVSTATSTRLAADAAHLHFLCCLTPSGLVVTLSILFLHKLSQSTKLIELIEAIVVVSKLHYWE